MIVEFGHYALILAFVFSLLGGAFAFLPYKKERLINTQRTIATSTFILVVLSFLSLIFAYVTSDFSVLNVIKNSHTEKPLFYKISAVWANHEGSMILWNFILASFALMVSRSKKLDHALQSWALSFQSIFLLGFLGFTLFTSNPFGRVLFAPKNGMGLNPVLQDPALAFHPPLLYFGYVGFSIVFSFALAALMQNRIDFKWATQVYPWCVLAWTGLTGGIALGSFWAYYELGWGGWWFWDPVENASLMPWLAGTALLHSITVLKKRKILAKWVLFLSLLAFSLSILGTFLVRSGLLTSVHSFALDTSRGVFLFSLFVFYTGGSLLLYTLKMKKLALEKSFKLNFFSRESFLLLNNLFLVTALLTVFVGTLYPLFLSVFGLSGISIGTPYFNKTFVPLMIPLVIMMGFAPFVAWNNQKGSVVIKNTTRPFIALVLTLILFYSMGVTDIFALFGLALGSWLTLASLVYLFKNGNIFSQPLDRWSLALAHAGLGIAILGMVGSAFLSSEKIVRLEIGNSVDFAGYEWRFDAFQEGIERNYVSADAVFSLYKDSEWVDTITASKRYYPFSETTTTEAGITINSVRDFYIVLGDWDKEKKNPSFHFYTRLFQPYLWLGFLLMALGGFLSVTKYFFYSNKNDKVIS